MSKAKSEEPAGPIVLTANVIDSGKFYPAGSETPFTEATLPEHLRQYLASGQEDFYSPAQRDIYQGQPAGPEPGFIFQGAGSGQWVQRQAARTAAGLQEQAWAEAEASAETLPPETLAVLEDEHTHRIDKLKAQAAYNAKIVDAAYESLAQASEPPALFVRRGGEMGRVERSKLKVGEAVYAKFGEGDWQVVGHVNANGEAPEPPLIP
jgi:hypothetical protein